MFALGILIFVIDVSRDSIVKNHVEINGTDLKTVDTIKTERINMKVRRVIIRLNNETHC